MKRHTSPQEQLEMFGLEEVLPLFTGTPQQVPFTGLLEEAPRPLPEGRSGLELPLPLEGPGDDEAPPA
jgi:hypothetical protein